MRPIEVTLTATGTSQWIPVDFYKLPFQLTLGVDVTGTATASVEYTVNNVWDPNVTPVGHTVTGLNAVTNNTVASLNFPVRAVRITAGPMAGTATLTILQGRSS
ncbi:hypothetical protein SDC9_150826 [bioreactor metagenome]|uniref:Uncharacterized protein n=1 Tax=bioreactor metagenome TaxID=1076179 RepID=A0A645ENK1_9ZZZZ